MPTKTRQQLDNFVETVSAGHHVPQLKFLRDTLRGLHVGKSCMLSEIGRTLREPKRLIHTERRLSRELKSPRFL